MGYRERRETKCEDSLEGQTQARIAEGFLEEIPKFSIGLVTINCSPIADEASWAFRLVERKQVSQFTAC